MRGLRLIRFTAARVGCRASQVYSQPERALVARASPGRLTEARNSTNQLCVSFLVSLNFSREGCSNPFASVKTVYTECGSEQHFLFSIKGLMPPWFLRSKSGRAFPPMDPVRDSRKQTARPIGQAGFYAWTCEKNVNRTLRFSTVHVLFTKDSPEKHNWSVHLISPSGAKTPRALVRDRGLARLHLVALPAPECFVLESE